MIPRHRAAGRKRDYSSTSRLSQIARVKRPLTNIGADLAFLEILILQRLPAEGMIAVMFNNLSFSRPRGAVHHTNKAKSRTLGLGLRGSNCLLKPEWL